MIDVLIYFDVLLQGPWEKIMRRPCCFFSYTLKSPRTRRGNQDASRDARDH